MEKRRLFRLILSLLAFGIVAGCSRWTSNPPAHSSQDASPDDVDPALTTHNLVFDGVDSDGRRRILVWRWRDGTPEAHPLGIGYVGSNPSPRADGRAILFQSLPTDTEPSGLMIADDFDKPARFLVERGTNQRREPDWSSDGTKLAFIDHALDPAGDLFIADILGDRLDNLRDHTPCRVCGPVPEPETTPAWSPDGTHLAFTSYEGVWPAIWTMAADGSGRKAVSMANPASADYFPAWSPDGRQIVFQQNSAGPARIGIVTLADGATRYLDLPGSNSTPAWSPDGQYLALASRREGMETDIVVVTAKEGTQLASLSRPGADYHPKWMAIVP